MVLLHADGRVRAANRRAGEMLGRPVAELAGVPIHTLVKPVAAGAGTGAAAWRELAGRTMEFAAADGENLHGRFVALGVNPNANDGDAALFEFDAVGTRVEARRAAGETPLGEMLRGGGQAVWDYDAATDIFNGYGFDALPGLADVVRVPLTAGALIAQLEPPEADKIRAGLVAVFRDEAELFEVQFRARLASGGFAHYLARATVMLRDEQGRVERLYGTCTDVTELVAGDQMLQVALENGRQGTWVWYPERDEIGFSVHWYRLLGYEAGSMSGVREQVTAIIHPDDRAPGRDAVMPMLRGESEEFEVQIRFRHGDGHYVWMLARARCVERDERGRVSCVVGTHADISQVRQQQSRLEIIAKAVTSGSETRLLNELTRAAAELTGLQFAAITQVDEHGRGTVTSAYPREGGLLGYSYDIAASPCSFSLEHETQVIGSGLAAMFPHEPAVSGAGLQAYVGRRLVDTDGRLIGIFALMDARPLDARDDVLPVLDVLAARAAAELQRELAHARLSMQERRLQAALEGGRQLVWEWDAETDAYTVYQPHASRFERTVTTGTERMQLAHPEDLATIAEARRAYLREETTLYEYEARYRDPADGRYRWTLCRGKASERDTAGRVRRLIGTYIDIDDLKQAQRQLATSGSFLELIVDSVPQYVYWKDCDSVYRGGNQRFAEFAGLGSADELAGRSDRDLWWHELSDDLVEQAQEIFNGSRSMVRHEREVELPNGEHRWFEVTRAPIRDGAGTITGLLGTMYDVTERRRAEEEAHRLALFDPLTSLPNRRYLVDRLQTTVASAQRHGGVGALLFIDLDQFKQINDTQGHSVGDLLLNLVAQRLQQVTRAEDTVARLGGDEFVVLLPPLASDEHAAATQSEAAAEKVRDALVEPYSLGGQAFHVTPTIGIALYPDAGKSVEDVLKEADTAMYSGKAAGRNAIRFFHPVMEEQARNQLALERDLRHALETDAFDLYFQPQVDADGRVFGAEALLRWQHPQRGMVSPAEFIPVAEERGTIVELGNRVVEIALARMAAWETAGAVTLPCISINVSARQFRHADFVSHMRSRIEAAGVAPSRIMLEITESTLMDDVDNAIARMSALRELGVRFSLDDFGVGYSSLSQLKRLPIDQLKIDRSFIDDIGRDPNDEIICRTIVAMGESLGLQIIAEGVETPAQVAFLRELNCAAYQGYYFLAPVPADEFAHYCADRELCAAPASAG